jgi:hypothetical protein
MKSTQTKRVVWSKGDVFIELSPSTFRLSMPVEDEREEREILCDCIVDKSEECDRLTARLAEVEAVGEARRALGEENATRLAKVVAERDAIRADIAEWTERHLVGDHGLQRTIIEVNREREIAVARVAEVSHELDRREEFLSRSGYRRCDIAACNCNEWHNPTKEGRLREAIEERDAARASKSTARDEEKS